MEAQQIKSIVERALVSFSGTSTSAGNVGGTTVVCSDLTGQPDYNGQSILIAEGTYAGQSRDIDGSTTGGTVTVSAAFGGQIASGINFHILTGLPSMAELDDMKGAGWTDENLTTIDANIDALLADIGDFSAQTNLQSLLAALGIPDVSGKSLYTCLVTDRLGTPARDFDTILGARWDSSGDLGTDIAAIIADITSAVDQPPTAKSLQDILHKDTNYAYSKATDSLEAISDELHRIHQHVFILFVIPELVASINADNTILQTELAKLGHVHTITQADALDFPAFSIYSLAVCGTNSGTAWTTDNLADLKTVLGLPILCVDKVAAAYFKIGTDGGDASTKTVIRAISEIEGTLMGQGEAAHESVTGLAAGNNTVSSSATYHTLNMSDADITEKVFCTESNDPDGGTANQDVVMGLIPRVLEDGTIGVDEEGDEVPATLGFLGFCYDASTLTTLGKGTFYLFCHMMIATKILDSAEEAHATIVDLRKRLLGNMKSLFTNAAPLVEFIAGQTSLGTKLPVGKSLYDLLGSRWDSSGDLGTDIAQILTYTDKIDDATDGLSPIRSALTTIDAIVDDISANLAAAINNYLGHGTHGLSPIRSALTTIDAIVDDISANLAAAINNYLGHGTHGLSPIRSALTTIDAIVDDISANLAAVINNYLNNGTYGLSAIHSDVATVDGVVDDILTDTAVIGALGAGLTALATAAKQNRVLCSMDFWSASQEEVALTGTATNPSLPAVTVAEIPSGATIVRVIAMFKFRMIEAITHAGTNALEGATSIQVKETSAGSYTNAITFVDAQFALAQDTREGGDVILGAIDIASEVDADGGYSFQWTNAEAEETGINFNDVQTGLRVWYSL